MTTHRHQMNHACRVRCADHPPDLADGQRGEQSRGRTRLLGPHGGLSLIVLILLAGVARAADDAEVEKARAAESLARANKRAEAFAFHREGGAAFKLKPKSLLNWTDPVYGHVYVWTDKGRPEVIGSLLKRYQPFTPITDEFHSLSTGPIACEKDGAIIWTTAKPGVEFKPIPGAPEPAATPLGRLRQIRELAKDFSGRENDREKEDRDMRLLTQPILRYEGTEFEPVDGALFVFAHGTDPDAILVIEARKLDGVLKWQYALVRMTTSALRVNHRSVEVWNVPMIDYGQVHSHKEPYTSFRTDEPATKLEIKP